MDTSSDSASEYWDKVAAADVVLMGKASAAIQKAAEWELEERYLHPPGADIGAAAYAMRIVQIGEGYKTLIQSGAIEPDTVLFEANGAEFKASTLARMRDIYAHPENAPPTDTIDISPYRDKILRPISQLQFGRRILTHDEEKAIKAIDDGVRHLSAHPNKNWSIFDDARNYKIVEAGGYLHQVSATGRRIMNSVRNRRDIQRPAILIKARDNLSHNYRTGLYGNIGALNTSDEQDALIKGIEEAASRMRAPRYLEALNGAISSTSPEVRLWIIVIPNNNYTY